MREHQTRNAPRRRSFRAHRARVVLVMLLVSFAPAHAQTPWRLRVDPAAVDPAGPLVATLLSDIQDATGGSLRLTPSATAPTNLARAISTAIRSGQADMAILRLDTDADRSALYAFDRIPGLAAPAGPNDDAPERLEAAMRRLLARRLAEDNLELLAWAPALSNASPGASTDLLIWPRPLPDSDRRTGLALALPAVPDAGLIRLAEILALAPRPVTDPWVLLPDPTVAAAVVPASRPNPTAQQAANAAPDGSAVPLRIHRLAIVAHRDAWQRLDEAERTAVRAAASRAEAAAREAHGATSQAHAPVWLADAGRQLLREWAATAGADGWSLLAVATASPRP